MRQKKESKLVLASAPIEKRGRYAKHSRRLLIDNDFAFSGEKTSDYYTGCPCVLTIIIRHAKSWLM